MNKIINDLQLYLSFPFVRYAIIVGVLVALCSSLLGVTLVLKRYSFIGDGLSHVAFGAMAVASAMKLANDSYITLPITIITAIILLRTGQNAKIKGDAAIAMLSVGALAIGYLLMNVFPPENSNVSGDVCTTLFGSTSILTLERSDVILCVVLSIVMIVLFLILYNRIFSVTFDENFVTATGKNANTYNLLIAIMIAVVIVLGMNLVGSLLISALIIFPALSAMSILNNFKSVVICSAIISVLCAIIGIFTSMIASTPVGSTIVACDMVVFLICYIIRKVRGA